MPVEDPGVLDVTCDRCGVTEPMDTTEFAGNPSTWGIDDVTIEGNGWVRSYGDDCTYCPKCKDRQDEDYDGDESDDE